MQYKINQSLLDKIEGTVDALDSQDTDKAKESIKEGKRLLTIRSKLLRLANKESWTAAIELQEEDLVSNSTHLV